VPKFVRLHAPDWHLDIQELRDACSDKTKAIIFNSPMNPTGIVFSDDDLKAIANIVQEFDLYAICDEVYEHLVFEGFRHTPLITLPGMAERCVRVGSAGKTFSLTGWKVGYISGPAHLIETISKVHQFMTFTTPPNLQRAVAWGLGQDDSYFEELSSDLQIKRDRLSEGLNRVGLDVMPCGGTYFVTTNIESLGFRGTDREFCEYITKEARVTAVPLSPFYDHNPATNFVRFCFSKNNDMLDEAIHRLGRLF
jgi:aspartate/methionine/tyrosine aminotransferase